MRKDLGIDLGSSRFTVFTAEQGIIFSSPSVIAKNRFSDNIVDAGISVSALTARTPGNIRTLYPLFDGISVQYDAVCALLSCAMDHAYRGRNTVARVIVSVPAKITPHEARSYIDAALEAGAREVYLLSKATAAAIGAGIDLRVAKGNLVIDMGAAHTDVAVLSLGGAVQAESIPIGGRKLDEAIADYVLQKYGVTILPEDAEALKLQCGTVWINDSTKAAAFVPCVVRGTGLPQTVTVTPDDLAEAIAEPVDNLAAQIAAVIARIDETLMDDIRENGILLTGGVAQLTGIDQVIEEATGISVHVAEEPIDCTVKGLGAALDYLDEIDGNKDLFVKPLSSDDSES